MEGSLLAVLGLAIGQASGSLTLAQAIELAHEHHQTPQIARAQVERAEAVRALALSALLPEVALNGTYTRQPERSFDIVDDMGNVVAREIIQEENLFTGRASLNVTLLEAKNFVVLQRAGAAFESVEMRAKETNRQLAFDVAQIYLAVLGTEQVASAARNRISVATKAKGDAGKRLEHGLAGDNDVTRADLELTTAELSATDADASARALRLQLERYVGPAAHSTLVPPAELFTPPTTTAEAITQAAYENRPDLAALRADAEAARIAANEPLWGLVPSLTLDAFYDATTQGGFTGEPTNWGVSVSANWILYDRGRRYRETDERTAQAREASLVLQRALDDTANEVARALVALDRAKVGFSRAETRVALSRKNAEEVAVRYREGIATAFELADANAQEFAANAELARAQFDLGVSILAVRELAGDLPL